MTADERAVLAANAAFYRAFAERDVAAMDALWARSVPVACIHPGWQVLNGREAVMASWRGILAGVPPAIRCSEAIARVAGHGGVRRLHREPRCRRARRDQRVRAGGRRLEARAPSRRPGRDRDGRRGRAAVGLPELDYGRVGKTPSTAMM